MLIKSVTPYSFLYVLYFFIKPLPHSLARLLQLHIRYVVKQQLHDKNINFLCE
jgi:hypothetical protein